MSRILSACVLVAVSTAFADDKKPEPKGEPVSGTVTLEEKPLSDCAITFVTNDGKTAVTVLLDENGKYTATVPIGEYRITIHPAPKKKADPKDPPKPAPAIPVSYSDPNKTPLTYEVKSGAQTLDIELKK
jgi:hypothetical protein